MDITLLRTYIRTVSGSPPSFQIMFPKDGGESRSELEHYPREHDQHELRVQISLSYDELNRSIAKMRDEKAEAKKDLDALEKRLSEYEASARERGKDING